MKAMVDNIKPYITFFGWILSVTSFIWLISFIWFGIRNDLKSIQKMTLRNTIWNETIPMHDRLESCDSYLSLGFNSETKKYCTNLLERND